MTRSLSSAGAFCALILAALCCLRESAAQDAAPEQDPTETQSSPAAVPEQNESSSRAKVAGDKDSEGALDSAPVIFRLIDGQWRPVTLVEGLSETDDEQAEPAADVPAHYLSRVALAGEAHQNVVDFDAQIDVFIAQENTWQRVPLRMPQAFLTDFRYEGPGEAVPAGGDAADGSTWMIRGRGRHTLNLTLRMPVRSIVGSRQIQLTLPPLPSVFQSQVRLRIPETNLLVRANKGVELRQEEDEDGTLILADVAESRLELSWQQRPEAGQNPLQVSTALRFSGDGEVLELAADQVITSEQGAIPEVLVRLPSEFPTYSISGERYVSHSEDPERPGWVRVVLQDSQGSPVRLNWLFERPIPASPAAVLIDGFEVDEARSQRGTVLLNPVAGHDLHWDSESGLQRVDVNSVMRADQETRAAFQFTPPFQLELQLEREEASLRSTPRYELTLDDNRAELEAVFQFDIQRGVAEEVRFEWEAFREQGWELISDAATRFSRTSEGQESAEQIRVRLAEPQVEPFQVTLRAIRVVDADENPLSFTLPIAQGGTPTLDADLTIVGPPYLEVTLSEVGETTFLEMPVDPLARPDERLMHILAEYRITSDQRAFQIDRTRYPPHLTSRSTVAATLAAGELHVEQRLEISAEFGYVPAVRIQVPAALADRLPSMLSHGLSFWLDSPNEGRIALEAEEVAENQMRVALPEPRLGKFAIVAGPYRLAEEPRDRSLPIPTREFRVPVLHVVTAEHEWSRLELSDAAVASAAVTDDDWQRVDTALELQRWFSTGTDDEVPLRIDRSLNASPLRLTIDDVRIVSQLTSAGFVETLATYVLRDPQSALLLRLPDSAEAVSFRWNGEELTGQIVPAEGSPRLFVLSLPELENGPLGERSRTSGQLTVRYQTAQGTLGWTDGVTVPLPQFAPGVWIEDLTWELILPAGHRLLSSPDALAPMYRWQRWLVFWRRVSPGELQVMEDVTGNRYSFAGMGAPAEVTFRTASDPFLLLVGAGSALIVGFLLLRVPVLRSTRVIVLAAFAFCVAGLWFLEILQVFAQPAAWGLVAVLMASGVESFARRDRARRTFGQESDVGLRGERAMLAEEATPGPTVISPSAGSSLAAAEQQ